MAWSGRHIQQQLQHLYGTASIMTWAWGLAAVASTVALLLLTRGRGEGGLSRQLQLESAPASREPVRSPHLSSCIQLPHPCMRPCAPPRFSKLSMSCALGTRCCEDRTRLSVWLCHLQLWCLQEPQRSYYNKRPCAFHKHSHTLRAAVSAILPVLGFTARYLCK